MDIHPTFTNWDVVLLKFSGLNFSPQKSMTLMAYPGYGTLPKTNSSHQKMVLLKQESLFPVVYFQELC